MCMKANLILRMNTWCSQKENAQKLCNPITCSYIFCNSRASLVTPKKNSCLPFSVLELDILCSHWSFAYFLRRFDNFQLSFLCDCVIVLLTYNQYFLICMFILQFIAQIYLRNHFKKRIHILFLDTFVQKIQITAIFIFVNNHLLINCQSYLENPLEP